MSFVLPIEPANTIFLRQLEGGPLHLQLLFSYDEPPLGLMLVMAPFIVSSVDLHKASLTPPHSTYIT